MKNITDFMNEAFKCPEISDAMDAVFHSAGSVKDIDAIFECVEESISSALAYYEMNDKKELMDYLEKAAKQHKLF